MTTPLPHLLPADAIFLPAGVTGLPVGAERSVQRCAACGNLLSPLDAAPDCPSCGGLLEILHRAPVDEFNAPLSANAIKHSFSQHCCAMPMGHASGVWRFESIVMPGAGEAIVSHPEGNTPLLSRAAISKYTGCDGLLIKHEGHNPTGSFKDRGMTVGTTQAVRIGASAVACASTGNTSAALASYAAQAGIPGLVFVPAGKIALGKLAQTLSYGARTLLVKGDFDECLRLVQQASRELGIYLLNSINPWRVEGQKTIVFEMLQQLGWNAPDFIVLPAGNLGNTAAFGTALREAKADRAVRAIRETDGLVISATDDEIIDAKVTIDGAGVGCEPASAASVAGVRRLVRDGIIGAGDTVVAVLTGHVLKDPGMLVELHQREDYARANRPIEIDATVSAVEAVLRNTRGGSAL